METSERKERKRKREKRKISFSSHPRSKGPLRSLLGEGPGNEVV